MQQRTEVSASLAVDLRSHLARLRHAGLLIDVDRRVDPSLEVSRLMAELSRRERAGLFSDVSGNEIPLVYNILGSRQMLGLALNTDPAEVTSRFREARLHPLAPERMASPAPSQEVIVDPVELDLRRLPLVVHSEHDAGAYITAGMVICQDPDTGARNVSFNRMTPVAPDELAIRMMPPQQLGLIQAKAESRGEDLPVAIAIGMHPTAALSAATSPPMGFDEFAIAGALRGEPVPMVPGLTVPIDVPAEAEIVIEGYVQAGVRAPEGPFGDFLHYYVPQMDNHRLRVTAMSYRRAPIYQTMHAGSAEDVCLLGLGREADLLAAVAETGAQVVGVRLRPTILGAVISIRAQYDGQAKTVAMAAFGRYRWLKYCIVVDDDVDIEDDADVWWAIANRADVERDVVVIGNAGGFPRDEDGMHNSKLLIDAVAPVSARASFLRRVPPGGPRLRLEDYVSSLGGIG